MVMVQGPTVTSIGLPILSATTTTGTVAPFHHTMEVTLTMEVMNQVLADTADLSVIAHPKADTVDHLTTD